MFLLLPLILVFFVSPPKQLIPPPTTISSSSSLGPTTITDKFTFFTTDGLIQIGGNMVPRRVKSSDKQGKSQTAKKYQRYQESNYMDPNQGLCLGALFDIAATNGLDMSRRLCIFGFCRSIEMLSDVVEDTVLEHGGELEFSWVIACLENPGSWLVLSARRQLLKGTAGKMHAQGSFYFVTFLLQCQLFRFFFLHFFCYHFFPSLIIRSNM
ncbi:hypothetical protein MTR_1g063100 [Medicago truncatula]|uniref:DUF7811 domain-containing protein n=1 Tax=Medicago truncatula TaxID=3880 RepID=A0A072VVQ5_MEDTR|nr:hypothetical protein MTR_1g063100 [Medicago truncatula]